MIWNNIRVNYFFTKEEVLRNVHADPLHTVKVVVNLLSKWQMKHKKKKKKS